MEHLEHIDEAQHTALVPLVISTSTYTIITRFNTGINKSMKMDITNILMFNDNFSFSFKTSLKNSIPRRIIQKISEVL